MERYASMHRKTNETEVTLELCLDGGERAISTGVGFLTTCSVPSPSTGTLASR